MFQFKKFPLLTDGELKLDIDDYLSGHRAMDRVPAYKFKIIRCQDLTWVGDIDVRIGNTRHLILYGGHIGYSVHTSYQGHSYAAKACNIIKDVALAHGMTELWITCNPENTASRKTCEKLGAVFVNIVDVPAGTELFNRGDYRKCRYLWVLTDPPMPS
ncbi:GNAT family N-acetyltransferase [Gynuella sp.]|uniref:GNAT family N-acetyltransferase n=1 Tax=Gynuella sp. TaxID=2969146 RepID=UPI003D0BBE28